MSLYNGYSLREISEQLGISYDNIRQRKRRAIKNCQQIGRIFLRRISYE